MKTIRPLTTLGTAGIVLYLASFAWRPEVSLTSAQERRGSAARDPRTEAFRKAYEAEQAQNYAAAVTALQAVQRKQQDYLLNYKVAGLYQAAGNFANARSRFEQAIRDSAKAIEPRTAVLLPLISLQRYADAEQFARQALLLDSANYYANLRLAYISRLQSKYAAADTINRRMLQLHPTDYNFLIEQALNLTALKKSDEARAYFRQVLWVAPNDAIAKRALSTGSSRIAEPNLDAYRKAAELEAEKNYKAAVSALVAVEPTKQQEYFANVRAGWLYYLAENHFYSRKSYETAVALAPKAVEPYVGLLLPLLAEKKFEQAEQTAREALKLDPKNYLVNLRLSYALRQLSKHAEAEKVSRPMLELYPSDVTLLLEHALALAGQKRDEEARDFFQMVQWLSPNDATAAQVLAMP